MAPHPTQHPSHPADVPLAVWPVAQTSAQYQRAGRYLPASTAHPGKMLPALAARIITEYSTPGQLVADPMAGIGTTLVEAALLDRRAIGIELEPRWADIARANLDHILDRRQRRLADIRVGDATRLPDLLGPGTATGSVDLIVVSPPYGCDAGVIDKPGWLAGQRLCPPDSLNYSTGKTNVGHARGPAYPSAMAAIYAGCHAMLRPGGLLVTVTKNTRRQGRCFDLAGTTVTLARAAGFGYLQHVIALHAAVRDSGLHARPSFWQLTQLRHAHDRGDPAHLVTHEDLCIFGRSGR
ncbi:MAG TPA: DNA methyltransferase [Mycobacteriales bacterium]|nr:DNA methyltransferase [Mycobacteriales bacterium]